MTKIFSIFNYGMLMCIENLKVIDINRIFFLINFQIFWNEDIIIIHFNN